MYTTQMDAARKGIITPQMKIVAEKERMDAEEIRSLVAKGQVIIPCNKNHKALHPSGVGARLTTKINVNLGVSRDWKDVDMEYEKVRSAVEMGAEAIMDLSSYGDTRSFRRKLTADCPAMIGTVPIYDAVVYYHKPLAQITAEEWLDIVRMHAEDGVDFMTIHCGMNRATAARFKQNKRLMNIVSRGGSIMFAWMEMTGNENPFYEHYDEILDICREYDITMSLGDACRPGCLADATDTAQIEELITLGELTKRAWAKDVQVMIEGPGFNIEVNHMVQMLYLYQPHALRNSSLSGTVRAEPVGVLTEFCFTYRLHDLQNTLLYDPIHDSWNSQRSGLSIGLWYFHSPYGSWMIITELFPYETDVFFLA